MRINILEQMRIFVFSAIFGALAGLVFDLFSQTSKLFKHRKIARIIFDFLYCVICLFAAVGFLFTEGGGQLEGYILFGAVLGAVLYFLSISNFCKRFIGKKATFRTKK